MTDRHQQFLEREFPFSKQDFDTIKQTVYKESGINLNDNKMAMVYSRLARRIRLLKLTSFQEYLNYLQQHKDSEIGFLVDLITTNVTSFFRENHHFEFLSNFCREEFISKDVRRKMKIWSAGCSAGQEPYSIAMTLENLKNVDYEILASDLSTKILAKAMSGVYEEDLVKEIPGYIAKKYFQRGEGENQGLYRIKPKLKSKIQFKQLNLIKDFPFVAEFDVLFCRNVIIYFDKETKVKILKKYHKALKPGGILFLGHSESIHGVNDMFVSCGKTTYKKV